MAEVKMIDPHPSSRTKILDAALNVIRAKGYEAARIEDICAAANLTKGSFFHHFKSKEDLALAAVERWSDFAETLFTAAPYRALADPVDRILGYVDFRKALLQGELPEYTCLAGTMVQEVYATHPAIRDACDTCFSDHAAQLETDIAQAMRERKIDATWSAESLALYTQVVIQGGFILAKAKNSADIAATSLDHLRNYLEMLFLKTSSHTTHS